jgi:hypothetical protein
MGAREPNRKPSRKEEATVVELDAAFLQRLGDRCATPAPGAA